MTCILAATAQIGLVGLIAAASYPAFYMLGDLYEKRKERRAAQAALLGA